ncbi:MAG: tyrosine-protein phosphatase [Bacteroidales bacterium]|nr:tyrosine-protein phosphatase [Bacteroidales bacterium]
MRLRYLLCSVLVPFIFACTEPNNSPDTPEGPETAVITAANEISVEEGQTVQIEATTNSSAPITYESADPSLATVSETGLVTGVKSGRTYITLAVAEVEGKFTAAQKNIELAVTAAPAPEIKNGDTVVSTNANVEKFLTDIHYETHDYSSTSLLTWASENDVRVCPGNSDWPQEYTIRWASDPSATGIVATVSEPTRDWTYTPNPEENFVTITNLLPNTHYTYRVTADGGKVLTEGEFDVTGKLHQLSFRTRIRNVRDLGGWKTSDGKTVKYRMVYRGGRLESSYFSKVGKAAIQTEGIKAQLDLRGHTSSGNQEYMNREDSPLYPIWGDEFAFCSPSIEEGYSQMLRDDKEKTRQCMQFIFDCVDANKPVYFHCSLGRDRTGTVAMLTLGILGVPEGDISQEYEITQFAPHGYATSEGEKTKMTRIADYKGAASVIWGYAGEGTFQEGVNAYLLEIGISQADIDKFKQNMLQ